MNHFDWFHEAAFFILSAEVTLRREVDIFNIVSTVIVATTSIKTAMHIVVSLPINFGLFSRQPNSKGCFNSFDSWLIVAIYCKPPPPPPHSNSFSEGDAVPLQLIEKPNESEAESDENQN